ncbi:hypothetical protein Q3G72_026835 [Acer saccharum]|nr:hypothetical protein Q3G72_026835 [Acer saccharum]
MFRFNFNSVMSHSLTHRPTAHHSLIVLLYSRTSHKSVRRKYISTLSLLQIMPYSFHFQGVITGTRKMVLETQKVFRAMSSGHLKLVVIPKNTNGNMTNVASGNKRNIAQKAMFVLLIALVFVFFLL